MAKKTTTAKKSASTSSAFDLSDFDFTVTGYKAKLNYDLRVAVSVKNGDSLYHAYIVTPGMFFKTKQVKRLAIGAGTFNGRQALIAVFDNEHLKDSSFDVDSKRIHNPRGIATKILEFYGKAVGKMKKGDVFAFSYKLVPIDTVKGIYLMEQITTA